MVETDQIHRSHHIYRTKLITTSALMEINDIIITATDKNEVTATMIVDQTAAFDCVEHELLLQTFEFYNIGEDPRNL